MADKALYTHQHSCSNEETKLKEDADGNKTYSTRYLFPCKVMKSRYSKTFEGVQVKIHETGMDLQWYVRNVRVKDIVEKVGNKLYVSTVIVKNKNRKGWTGDKPVIIDEWGQSKQVLPKKTTLISTIWKTLFMRKILNERRLTLIIETWDAMKPSIQEKEDACAVE